jgi:DNA-binding response OmpR family regulator
MEKWGFKAVITQDDHEAMAALRGEQAPTLALLDWMTPGLDGLEVCRRVRERKKTVYVIMLTSLGAKENIVEGSHAGADDYLTKPFDKNELLARIQVGLRILELHSTLAARVKELEKAVAEIDDLKVRFPL